MTEFDESRMERTDENEPAAQRQRLPWHAPKLILSSSVQQLTGSHRLSPSANANPSFSNVS
jgi:hypothetical protein